MKKRPLHRYLVTDVGPRGEQEGLELGSLFVYEWVGHNHTFMAEKGGILCTAKWAGRYESPVKQESEKESAT